MLPASDDMMTPFRTLLGVHLLLSAADAFVLLRPALFTSRTSPFQQPVSLLGATGVSTISSSSTFLVSDAWEIVKSGLIGVGGLVAVLLLIAVVFANVIIPQAAEQLEQITREADPELWQEYQDKLEPGETLAMRPDLIQELGRKVQTSMNEAIAKAREQQEDEASPSEQKSSASNVVDAEIVPRDDKD